MPVSINTAALKYRDQQGTYQSINSIKGDNGALNIVAPAYENLTYPVAAGQGCIYNDLYYVAKQDIASQESWTAGHWEQRMIADEVHGIIDDTAGTGDTDKTFSADKLTSMNYSLLNALNQSTSATNSDIGKAHSPKTVDQNGYVTEWQYIPVGGGGSVDPEDIAEAVDAWCDENITNPSNPPLDRSLSLENAAAPADLVGELKSEVQTIEDLGVEKKQQYFTFVQGGVNEQTGELDTTSTSSCRTDKIPAKSGDTFTFNRTVNKIALAFRYVIYDENGDYVSGTTAGQGTYTMENDGMFCLMAWANNTVSATLEEAIATSHESFYGEITTQSNIVKAVNELDERVEAIEESGITETAEKVDKFAISAGLDLNSSDLKKGFYYKIENGIVSKVNESGTNCTDLIDVSDLIGQHLIVETKTRRAGSIRSFGFCDAQNNVGSYATETSMNGMYTGIYRKILLVDKPFFFFSMSSDATNISIRIEPKYDFYEKKEIDVRLDSQKFYHLSFDDVIECLQDITTNENTYESVFENDFLGWCKKMHDIYGTTFSMYVFYANDASNPTWTLENCTNAFADEFKANADWLRFGFHAYAQGTTATSRESTIATDYANTITELVRITGSVKCIDRMPRLQSYTGTLTALKAIRDCNLGCVGFLASANESASTRRDSYYFTEEQNAYIDKHIYMYDAENHLHFVKTTYLWGSSSVSVATIETSIEWFNANRYVELFTHENQLTSGQKSTFEGKIASLCYEHLPIFMMDKVLTS